MIDEKKVIKKLQYRINDFVLKHSDKKDCESAKAYARAKDGQDPKYLNCPDSWLQKCIYSDYEVKEEKPKGPQQPEEEPGIDMWNGEDEPKNGETV